MIERTYDVAALNAIANHPDVYESVRGPIQGPLDLTGLVHDQNIILKTDGGMFVFVKHGEGLYEVHTLYPPGRGAAFAAEQAARFMFVNTDCEAITTMVPQFNQAARRLTERMGFEYVTTKGWWPVADGSESAIDHFQLTLKRWVQTRFTCQ